MRERPRFGIVGVPGFAGRVLLGLRFAPVPSGRPTAPSAPNAKRGSAPALQKVAAPPLFAIASPPNLSRGGDAMAKTEGAHGASLLEYGKTGTRKRPRSRVAEIPTHVTSRHGSGCGFRRMATL